MSCQPWILRCPICDAPDNEDDEEVLACIEAHERPPEPDDFDDHFHGEVS